MTLEDIQNTCPDSAIPINHVGISDLRYPIIVLDRQGEPLRTVGLITVSVGLSGEFRGTHMSRFIDVLNDHCSELTMKTLPDILATLQTRFQSSFARIDVRFPYFLTRQAPATGASGIMDYDCRFVGKRDEEIESFQLSVEVPVSTLCPCSKAVSDYGAHNQRGHILIEVRPRRDESGKHEWIWIEGLIDVAEASASSPVFPALKRPDERHLTMQAYNNPVFVEDMVRNVAAKLQRDERIAWFKVRAENHESIHNHNAFAVIEWDRNSG